MFNIDTLLEEISANTKKDISKTDKEKSIVKIIIENLIIMMRAIRSQDKDGKTLPQDSTERTRYYVNAAKTVISNCSLIARKSRLLDMVSEVAQDYLPDEPDEEESNERVQEISEYIKQLRKSYGISSGGSDIARDFVKNSSDYEGMTRVKANLQGNGKGISDKENEYYKDEASRSEFKRAQTLGRVKGGAVEEPKMSLHKVNATNSMSDEKRAMLDKQAISLGEAGLKEFKDIFPEFKTPYAMVKKWAETNAPADEAHKFKVIKKFPNSKNFLGEVNGKKFRFSGNYWSNTDWSGDRIMKPAMWKLATCKNASNYDPSLLKYLDNIVGTK